METLVLRLPYYLHQADGASDAPLLLFLHGVGEGYTNIKDAVPVEPAKIGHQNLFNQGPPKFLERDRDSADHLVARAFTLVAPQLPDRNTSWEAAADDLCAIVARHRPTGSRVLVMGFSKGGLGAFQVGKKVDASALVVIDASAMRATPAEAISDWVSPLADLPFWAIHTAYEEGMDFRTRVQGFNEQLPARVHDGLSPVPAARMSWRTTRIAPPEKKTPVERHVWICDEASKATGPYEWLLRHA